MVLNSQRPLIVNNMQISYFVLGTYAVLIAVSQIRSGSKKSAAIAATPEPETPDYHTGMLLVFERCAAPPSAAMSKLTLCLCVAVIPKSSDIPSFGTPEWEAFIQSNSDNFQVWLESNFKEGAAATH